MTATTAVAKAKITPNLPADLREELTQEALNIKERIGAPAGDFITVTREKTFRLPGVDKEGEQLRVIVVDFAAVNQYYKGKYDPKNIQPPVCMAVGIKLDEMHPSKNSPEPQDDGVGCKECPQNQWGTDGRGKACKNQRTLAVVSADEPEGPLMVLKVSPTGVKFWDQYANKIANSGAAVPHVVSVVTLITFDPNSDYPSLRFTVDGLNDKIEQAAARRKEARQRLLAEPDLAPKLKATDKR